MKKSLIIISVFILILIKNQASIAEDWSSVYESYKEAEYGKIISEQDYENAIKALKEYQKPNKKVEKTLKEKGLNLDKDRKKIIFENPAREEPVLMLPINVSYNGKVIQQGFYLAKPVNKNNRYFIRLTQGKSRIIAELEANVFKTENLQKITDSKEKIFSQIMKNDMLKITYSNREFILETYLIPVTN